MKTIWNKFKNSEFYKTYKEEIVAIPVLWLLLFLINALFQWISPNDAFFSPLSQAETIFLRIVTFIVALATSWFGMRIAFPQIYKTLHEKVYHKWNILSEEKQIDYAIKFLWVFIIAMAIISRG